MSSTNMIIAMWLAGMLFLIGLGLYFWGSIWPLGAVTVTTMVWTWYCGEKQVNYNVEERDETED